MILVTGGTGLVGSHLLYQLSLENEKIIAICRASSDLKAVKRVFSHYTNAYESLFNKITWKIADINDVPSLTKAFEGITIVYHAAAIVSFNAKDYHSLRKVNIEGTANMVNLAIENTIEKFCFVSSIATIGKPINNTIITEENEWNIEAENSGYAISKYGAEIEVWRGSQEGLNVIIVNPGVILGAGFWQTGSGKLFDIVYKGFNFYTEGVTGFVSVADVVNSMLKLMKSDIKNERFILISENKPFKEVFFAIADAFGKKRPAIKTTKLMGEIAWRLNRLKSFFTQKEPSFSKESARAGNRKSYFSNEKVCKAIDYQFEAVETSIKRVCSNYK